MNSIIDYWFSNENVWFNSTPDDDIYITNTFGYLLENLDLNIINNLHTLDNKTLLSYIILTDQFPRHIFRNNNKYKIDYYHNFAIKFTDHIINNNMDILFNDSERCFILLPYRHTFNIDYINIAIKKVLEYIKENKQSKYFKRFLKASIYSLSSIITDNITIEDINNDIDENDIIKILDSNSTKIINKPSLFTKEKLFYNTFKNTLSELNTDKVVISISGGVDSMVSSYILSNITRKMDIKLIGVMINYNNRDETLYEVELVKRWALSINMDLYVRHINEIKRTKNFLRDEYEKITRKIRFDMYKKFNCPIFLGHNLDDCVENIFTNLSNGRLSNLRGMDNIIVEDNCTIVRPMLNISKCNIINFAISHNIPFLYDSTPKWSKRGQIRDDLVPFLNKFDKGIIQGLIEISDNYKNMNMIIDNSILIFYQNKIIKKNDKCIIIKFKCNDELKFGYMYWKKVISLIMKDFNIIISNKSIKFFVNKMLESSSNNVCLSLNVNCKLNFIKKNLKFFINI